MISATGTMNNLDKVTCTIVDEMGAVGLYHYNKLTYLFEYLFIRNFGKRYTGEYFPKLPHGPVITDYKKQIKNLVESGIVSTDIPLLMERRKLDEEEDFDRPKIFISKTDFTHQHVVEESDLKLFVRLILSRYSRLSTSQLEKAVYQTAPVIKCQENIKRGFQNRTGAYVLKNCIKISDFNNSITRGRLLALEHSRKHPGINFELQKKHAEELSCLEKLRPQIQE